MNDAQQTCDTCEHFKDAAVDPRDMKRKGECRALPPPATVHLMQGQAAVICAGIYSKLPATTPACGLHKPRLTVVT